MIIGMWYVQLCKQCGCHITLVHYLFYSHTSLAQCTSTPDHGNMEVVCAFVVAAEHAAMVWNKHHEHVVPYLRYGLQTINQSTDSCIGICKDVQRVVIQAP